MKTVVQIAKAFLIGIVATVAVIGVLLVVFLSWLDSLSLDLNGFQFG